MPGTLVPLSDAQPFDLPEPFLQAVQPHLTRTAHCTSTGKQCKPALQAQGFRHWSTNVHHREDWRHLIDCGPLMVMPLQMVIAFLVVLQHIPATYFLIHTLNFGYIGAAYATVWSSVLATTLVAVYVRAANLHHRVWASPPGVGKFTVRAASIVASV